MESGRASATRASGMSGSPTSRPSPFGNFTPQAPAQPRTSQDRPTMSRKYSNSPNDERRSVERYSPPSQAMISEVDALVRDLDGTGPASALMLRKLSASMTTEALNSMLLFASDLVEARFLQQPELNDERGFQTAIAVFSTLDGALEVRKKLHGKSNASNESAMIVEVIKGNDRGLEGLQRRSPDAQPRRQMSLNNHNAIGVNGQGRSSRFTTAFQSLDQVSPTRHSRGSEASDISSTNASNSQNMQDLFGPQSPVKAFAADRHRNSVRAMTGDDATDDEERELLSNPVAFAEGAQRQRSIHSTFSQFSNLRLNTNSSSHLDDSLISPKNTSYMSNRHAPTAQVVHSPHSDYSASFSPMSPGSSFQLSPQQFPRHQFPPANPADQNPPCNTLYVGNLPHETSEDELKSIFSRQRGYKRLCFRTKHNGPMCFVEFEDVSFATKALKELYGVTLHNSQRGGIRLSFSKNPLGVRNGQNNMTSPLNSPMAGFGNVGFASVNGPPPGLGFAPAGSAASPDLNHANHGLNIYKSGSPPQIPISHPNAFQSQAFSNGYMTGPRGYGSIGAGLPDPLIRR